MAKCGESKIILKFKSIHFRISRFVLWVLFTIANSKSYGAIQIGSLLCQTTDGRPVPGAYLGLRFSDILINGYMTGVKTPLYYQSGYMVTVQSSKVIGRFGWGELRAGYGIGAYYSPRGYRETETSTIKTSEDFNGGPAFHLKWEAAGPFFISIQSVLGMRNPILTIQLRSQDMTALIAGFEL